MTPLAPSQTSDDYIQAKWDFHKDKYLSQSGKLRFNSKLRRSIYFYHYTAYQQCITLLKDGVKWNQMAPLPCDKTDLESTLGWKIFCPLSQVFRHSFLKSNTVSLFRSQFPLKSGLEFRWNNSFESALDICHFFLKQHFFCPKLQLTDKIVYTLLNFWYPPKRCLQEKHFCVVPGALRAISKANHPHLLAASQLLAPTTNVSTPLF